MQSFQHTILCCYIYTVSVLFWFHATTLRFNNRYSSSTPVPPVPVERLVRIRYTFFWRYRKYFGSYNTPHGVVAVPVERYNFCIGTTFSYLQYALRVLPRASALFLFFSEYLPDPKEYDLYLSMANDDGWCKHFDKENRACTIYTDRPRFCRVEKETFGSMYGVEPEDMDDFCSACCNEQITDVYGGQR